MPKDIIAAYPIPLSSPANRPRAEVIHSPSCPDRLIVKEARNAINQPLASMRLVSQSPIAYDEETNTASVSTIFEYLPPGAPQ